MSLKLGFELIVNKGTDELIKALPDDIVNDESNVSETIEIMYVKLSLMRTLLILNTMSTCLSYSMSL